MVQFRPISILQTITQRLHSFQLTTILISIIPTILAYQSKFQYKEHQTS